MKRLHQASTDDDGPLEAPLGLHAGPVVRIENHPHVALVSIPAAWVEEIGERKGGKLLSTQAAL